MLQNPSTFFHFDATSKPKESKDGRKRAKRYSHLCSESLLRDLERTCDAVCIDDQIRPHEIPPEHDTCVGIAAKWGPMKLGESYSIVCDLTYCLVASARSLVTPRLLGSHPFRLWPCGVQCSTCSAVLASQCIMFRPVPFSSVLVQQ